MSDLNRVELLAIWDGLNRLPETAVMHADNQSVTIADLKNKVRDMANISGPSEVQRLRVLYERERDIADQLRESQQTTMLRNLQLAKDLEDSMDEVQRLREALQWTLSTLTRMTAGEPVRNLDEVIAGAVSALSPQKGETNG